MGGIKQTSCESYCIPLRKLYPYLRGKECDPEEPVSFFNILQMLFSELDLETCAVKDS